MNPPNLNCDSCNVVYIFHCNLCNEGLYVGETKTSFRFRFNNHKKSPGFPVAEHLNLPRHSLENLKVTLIASNFVCTEHRKSAELNWILKLNSHITGLNKELGVLNQNTFHQTT
ncbi:hypothetical protein HOLleu_39510 [Holothuria leucospilota]|uniref:GIY-YIG domain-containing protein n=1 Tax=Holothuria leucospilota TaxID=206669 RepID=A0A9Q0YG98_HOLLE|nr:hypothetical protein HOLleu_39510 [Holothuria leucospilota]